MVRSREGSTIINIYVYTVLKFEFVVPLPWLKNNPCAPKTLSIKRQIRCIQQGDVSERRNRMKKKKKNCRWRNQLSQPSYFHTS
jgi:hypothetical protein